MLPTTWNFSVSTTAISPDSGMLTNTRLLSAVPAQSIGVPFRRMLVRVLVVPPTSTVGSITVRLLSLFSTIR
ncbi:hypothetical protein D9M72_647610 [compost metagenome]